MQVWSLGGGYSTTAARPLRKLDPLYIWVWIVGLEEGSDHLILNGLSNRKCEGGQGGGSRPVPIFFWGDL